MSERADEADHATRMKALEARIAALKGEPEEKSHTDEHYSQAHLAWRMVIELVAGLGIGFGIGFALDSLFGTMPLFLVLFILLGFVAGIRTMLRSAREIQDTQLREAAENEGDARGD